MSKGVERKDLKETPHGPDVEYCVDAIRPYLEAGFDELILHQIGPEQDGFLTFLPASCAPLCARVRMRMMQPAPARARADVRLHLYKSSARTRARGMHAKRRGGSCHGEVRP